MFQRAIGLFLTRCAASNCHLPYVWNAIVMDIMYYVDKATKHQSIDCVLKEGVDTETLQSTDKCGSVHYDLNVQQQGSVCHRWKYTLA